MKARPMVIQHDLFPCPACNYMIRAEVTVQPNLGTPTLSADKRATVPVNPTIELYKVTHLCLGRITKPLAIADEVSDR